MVPAELQGGQALPPGVRSRVKLVGHRPLRRPLNEGPIIEQKSSGSTTPSAATSWSRVGRDAKCLALADAVQWHCERLVLLNGTAVVFR